MAANLYDLFQNGPGGPLAEGRTLEVCEQLDYISPRANCEQFITFATLCHCTLNEAFQPRKKRFTRRRKNWIRAFTRMPFARYTLTISEGTKAGSISCMRMAPE